MWTSLNREDFRKAQDEMRQRRMDMEARHAEEIQTMQSRHAEEFKGLDAKVTQLADMERAIDEFFREHMNNSQREEEQIPHTNSEQDTPELAAYLKQPSEPKETPLELKVVATNWGNASFIPAHKDFSEP